MNHQLTAVLSTYTTRRSVQILFALGCVFYLLTFFAALDSRHDRSDSEGVVGVLTFSVMIFAYLLASQAKWQFVDPRARIVPGFATNHLIVLAGLAFLSVGAAPALLGWSVRMNALGFAACSIAIASSMVWLIQGKAAQALVLSFGTISLMIRPGVPFWLAPEYASLYWPYHLTLLCVGWAAFGGWLVRLANLREEQRDYSLPLFIQSGSATRMERVQASRVYARLYPNGSQSTPSRLAGDDWRDRLAGMQASNTRARQRLLRYGFSSAPAWLTAVRANVGFLATLSLFWIIKSFIDFYGDNFFPFFSYMIAMPTILAPCSGMMRRGTMPQELLLPLSRRSYIDGLLVGIARNAAVTWGITMVAVLAMTSLLAPQTMSVPFVVAFTALSLSAHLYAIGALTWVGQTQSGWRRLLTMLLVGLPAMGVISAGVNAIAVKPSPPPIHSSLPASFGQHLSAEQRAMIEQSIEQDEQIRNEQLRKSREPNPAIVWSIAAALGSVGAVCTVVSRRKWMNLELAAS